MRKRLNIFIDRWQIFKSRFKGLSKIIGTLGKGIRVGTIMKITTISLGIETGIGTEMVIKSKKMIIKTRVACMFHRGIVMLSIEIQGWKLFL